MNNPNDEVKHYGTKRHSGRYPWGSSGHTVPGSHSFLHDVQYMRKEGMSEKEIAQGFGISIQELRNGITIANETIRQAKIAEAIKLKDKGLSNVAIGKKMGINESSVRALLKPAMQTRAGITEATADVLKDAVSKKKYIDIGTGAELALGISNTKLKAAVQKLQDEGYTIHYIKVEQAGTGKHTSMKVLAAPDTEWKEVNNNRHEIKLIQDYKSNDGGRSFYGLNEIKDISQDRVMINYAETGGTDKDGVIELRRGVADLDLGNSNYAQVRISVDGTHYLKGMAMYANDLPDGVDIRFNTNKSNTKSKMDVLKKQTDDPDNPFGATVKDQRGAINIVNEEGDWSNWSKNLSSQFLSKQRPQLIKQQLDLAYDIKQSEYEEIMSLTNPTVQKKLLESFSDDLDSAAVHLKAAALPRQGTYVILPFPGMKENEIYAPNYRDGEKLALVRHPHGGVFEIPVVTVNNKQKNIQDLIGRPGDAVGIHPKVAQQLSGADFDGDSVIAIPTNGKTIKTSSPLKGLKTFDPQQSYPGYDGMKVMSPKNKQMEMGKISNLITDMTIMGANESEIARAVRHSMVVIDAEKHKLNYQQSYIDNDIASLKQKYQGGKNKGAATLISKASSEKRVLERKQWAPTKNAINPKTGEKIYEETGESYINKQGKLVYKQSITTKLGDESDARKLSSGTIQENIYADYSNRLKAMANDARKKLITTKPIPYSPSAKKTYANEVRSLDAKLRLALTNAPRERQAQLFADRIIRLKKKDSPDITYEKLRRIKGQAIQEARARVGAKKTRIDISPKEWAAIQAGAISNSKLSKILNNTDLDLVKQYATPRQTTKISAAKMAKARAMERNGYTQAEIADAIGVSTNKLRDVMTQGVD